MNSSGDAAEQVVRLSLEGFEVVAKVSGEAAKSIAVLLISALKQEQKTKGRARLTNMIKSGKELKVYTVQQKDLKEFTKHAKKYGVLYTVLRDKNNKDKNAFVDIIARADDASKIQRIIDRFDLATVDKGTIVSQSEKAIEERKKKAEKKPTNRKTMSFLTRYLPRTIRKNLLIKANISLSKKKTLLYLRRKKALRPRTALSGKVHYLTRVLL